MTARPDLPHSSPFPFAAENGAIWLVAIVGLSLSLAALLVIQQQLDAHKSREFEWVAYNRIRALDHGVDNSLLALTTMRDHILASKDLDAAGFRRFGEPLLNRYRGIHALMWVPLVPGAQRQTFETDAATGLDPFQILEPGGHFELVRAAERVDYFPVAYVVAGESVSVAPGFDLGSIPSFRATLERARDQGKISASGRILYPPQYGESQFGFMVASYVSRQALTTPDAGPPQDALAGFVVGFFGLGELINEAVSLLEPRGVEILVVDETAPAGERFLHFYPSRLSPRDVGAGDYERWRNDEAEPKVTEHIQVADRRFAIICGRTELFRSAEAFHQGPVVALVAGLLFTLLLSFYLARIKENIRQRLAMERRLVEREELFRQMTETVDEAFWASTADGSKLIYLSPAFEKILGLSPAGRHKSLLDVVHPEDRSLLADALPRIGREGSETEIVHRIQRVDGVMRWVRSKGFPVKDERGRVYRLVGFLEDITERKLAEEALRESEAKLRDMFQQSPDVIMTVDQSGTILLMNRSTPALPADQAPGRSSAALMPGEFRGWYGKALKKVFRKGSTKQFRYSMDDGSYWEGRIVPIRNDDGPVTAAMVIASDVTEKRNLEAQSLRNARLASIGVLAAGVAHEINNPNNAIQFNASLVTRAWRDVTPILQEYFDEHGDFALSGLAFSEARHSLPRLLEEITRNSDRIRRIVQNLKHMSRQDTGELTANVDIQQVLEATIMILHNQIQKHTDVCRFEVPDGLPPVRGNSQQLEQVFINVLLNALQALPERTRGVYIRAELDPKAGMVRVSIRDEGRGISEHDLGRLTEPFYTTRTEAGGTGLGLSISRAIIERHGGSMMFESEWGTGTTVSIRIPTIR